MQKRGRASSGNGLYGIFGQLDVEWDRLASCDAADERLEVWALAEPVLAGYTGLAAVVAGVRWAGYQPLPQSQAVLTSLLRLSADPLAARALLQALAPRLRAERVVSARFGHGVGDRWQDPCDTVADLVAEAFVAIRRHAGEQHADVARLVTQEATRRLRTARQAHRRHQARTAPLPVSWAGPGLAQDLMSARTSAEQVTELICTAVRQGKLSAGDAGLVYATRVKGLAASEVGRAYGMAPKAVYYALAKAERALCQGGSCARAA